MYQGEVEKAHNFGLVQSSGLAACGVLRPPHLRRPPAAQPDVGRTKRDVRSETGMVSTIHMLCFTRLDRSP
jgi:hypothetical protein